MQRLRVKFGRGDKLKFLSHLDLMRLWERAIRRAGITPAFSEGYTPHPRISLAAPLPVGITSSAELMDVFLNRSITPAVFISKMKPQLPEDIEIIEAVSVQVDAPSLQSRVRFAEYSVGIDTEKDAETVRAGVDAIISAGQLPWHHSRDTGERHYDLRALIDDLSVGEVKDGGCTLVMRLRCDPSGSGRPEQVARALGFPEAPRSIHRTKLILG